MPWFVTYALILGAPLFGMYYFNIKQVLNAGEAIWHWNRAKARLWFVAVSSCVNLLPFISLVTFWFGGREAARIFSGEDRLVDYFLVYPFWFSLVIAVQVFLLFVFWKFGKFLTSLLFRTGNNPLRAVEPKVVVGIFLLAVGYSCFTIYADTWTIRVNEREVILPQEFSGLDGVRIVQIADIQGDARTKPERIRTLVEKVNSYRPDLILFNGDVVTSGPKYVRSTVAILSELEARHGKIAVLGDHDMFSGKQPIIDGLSRAGFVVLEDSSMRMRIDGTPVVLTGIVYTYRQRPSNDILETATDNGNDSYKILLVHQPRVELVHYASEKGYHLFTAGHSHGGAIAFGIPGVFLVAPSRFETKYFTGFYEVGDMLVSVNNGLGHTLAPIRFQAPVEITVIRLVR